MNNQWFRSQGYQSLEARYLSLQHLGNPPDTMRPVVWDDGGSWT